MGMHFDMTGIDHQPFIIRFVDQNFQKFFPYTFSAPSDEPLMNASPLPVIRRQVTPRRSGPQYPEYCIDKTTVILGDSSPLSSPSGQMGFQLCPYIIAYIMSVTGCFHLFRSCLFMMLPFYHNPLALCRQYLSRVCVDYRRDDFTSSTYISMQIIAKAVSTTGCAAITPFNFQKWFRIMTPGINSTAFLRSVMVSDFTALPSA